LAREMDEKFEAQNTFDLKKITAEGRQFKTRFFRPNQISQNRTRISLTIC
jgi:hypothetical protein